MIWQLVKRETAWRELYGSTGVVAAVAVFLPQYATNIFVFLVGLCWIRSMPAERASRFRAGLPISASDLFLSRALAFLALVWLPGTAGALTLLLTHRADAGVMLLAAAGLSVLLLAPLSHRIRQLGASQWAPAISIAVFSAAAWPATYYIPRPILTAVCLAIGAALFAATWLRLPLSFEVVVSKRDQVSNRSLTVAARNESQRMSSSPKHWMPVLRSAIPPMSFMFLPLVVMVSINGQWSFASAQATFPMMMAFPRISWLSGLPVRRGTLLALVAAPWLLILAINLALGGLAFPARTPIQFDYLAGNVSSVRPPLEFWSVAPSGDAPVVESPWHETWRPPVQNIAGLAIYNPYSVGPANSHRFMAWQYSRAMLAVYGQAVAFEDYHRPATLRPLEQQPRFVAINVAACLTWVLLLLNVVLLAMHWRVNAVFPRAYQAAGFLVLLPMMLPLALDLLLKLPGSSNGTALMNAVLLRVLALLPGGVAPVFLAGAVPMGILVWTARRVFEGVEPQPYDPTIRA